MTEPESEWRINLYIGMAAAAGSIVALGQMEWKRMSWPQIGFTLLSGFFFAVFAVPYIAEHWFSLDMSNPRNACGVTFIGGTFWNALMPLALRKVKKLFGLDEETI